MPTVFTVHIDAGSYPVYFADDLHQLATQLAQALGKTPAFLVTENQVCEALHLQRQAQKLIPQAQLKGSFIGQAGETLKSIGPLTSLYEALAEAQMDRYSVLIAIGGGVVGDLAGFTAATYLRGIPFYQVPTSLIGMVDSCIGGKTGINLPAGKNLVGAFHQPAGVFICPELLKTMPLPDFYSGMAEIIKYGLLADASLLEQLDTVPVLNQSHSDLPAIIQRCCSIKADFIRKDPEEKTLYSKRICLNLGHTFAHAIEAATHYTEYSHGQAVGIGLYLALRLSELLGHDHTLTLELLKSLLTQYNLPMQLKQPLPIEALCASMKHDKKAHDGALRFVVLKAIGQPYIKDSVPESWIRSLWKEIGATE